MKINRKMFLVIWNKQTEADGQMCINANTVSSQSITLSSTMSLFINIPTQIINSSVLQIINTI